MLAAIHFQNFYAGWALILAGFISGAASGLSSHRDDFLGGYTSFRRRMVRLGHIALVALGSLNILFATTVPASSMTRWASIFWIVGGVTMPLVCFLTAWKKQGRHVFFVPVMSLIMAVILILAG